AGLAAAAVPRPPRPAAGTPREPPAVPAASAPDRPAALPPIAGEAWVLVTLSHGEWERLDKKKPARILPLAHQSQAKEVIALPSGMEPVEDAKPAMPTVRSGVPGKD